MREDFQLLARLLAERPPAPKAPAAPAPEAGTGGEAVAGRAEPGEQLGLF
jgi:hypothetical protein